ICRLFVLPMFQGRGLGSGILKFAEEKISEKYSEILLDSSLPAKGIYLKKGYSEKEYHIIKTENGDKLCYDVMKKSIKRG
ncbi:MAG: GNAT family N-acetyltransferase, partial [Ruminococcus sp.]|nr:GNAT family N-acetyltransferase [Ruminococcus sp.]